MSILGKGLAVMKHRLENPDPIELTLAVAQKAHIARKMINPRYWNPIGAMMIWMEMVRVCEDNYERLHGRR